MASISQLYSDYTFSSNYPQLISTPSIALETYNNVPVSSGAIWGGEEKYPTYFENSGIDIFPPECDVSSSVPAMSLPEQLGVSDLTVPTLMSDNSSIGLCGIAGNHHFSGTSGFQLQDVSDFGDECCGFVQDIKPVYTSAASGENWGIQGNQVPTMEDTNIKVGRYSAEERKDRILRYLKKRNQRNFNKTIKYACRKTLADRRVRVRGRFARNNELCEDEMMMKSNDNARKEEELCCANSVQIKQDEDWLQEAMASLMYLPYIAG